MLARRHALWTTLAILVAGIGSACGGFGDRSNGPSILLLTLDTTRADALSCYGESVSAHTPHIDRLAAEGIRFDAAFTAVPLTLPAHASILTGLYPLRHGLRNNGMGTLPGAAVTLAERAQAEGYQTAAFVSAAVLDAEFGLTQGFDTYGEPESRGDDGEAERPASEVIDAAMTWLDTRETDQPFLLWLHFYDPHTPYAAPGIGGCEVPDETNALRSTYLAEVCGMDAEIGRLLDSLRQSGELDRTVVVAVGDHGEAFGEHGEEGHTVHCYDTTLRVPLILRMPDQSLAGSVRTEIVSIVDVLPTLADIAGWPLEAGRLDGLSLVGEPAAPDRGVYFESYYGYLAFGWSPIAGWLDASGKYVHSSEPAFFDLAEDPGEMTNRIASRRDDARRHQLSISDLMARIVLPSEDAAFDEELLEDLRGLGYVSVGAVSNDLPSPLAPSNLPSADSMIEYYELSLDALELGQSGKPAEAKAILERVVAVNARNPFVLAQLSGYEMQLREFEDAAATLRQLIGVQHSQEPGPYFRLGVCLRALGLHEEAIEPLETAVRLRPTRARFLRELIATLREVGRPDEAAPLVRQLQSL